MPNPRKDMEFTNVEFGSCAKYACDWRIYLIIPGLVFGCFLTFFQAVPGTLVTQAIVPDHLRSAALGLNALFYRIFGTIPVPILAAKEWFLLFFVLTKYFIFKSTKKKNETGDRFKMSLVEYDLSARKRSVSCFRQVWPQDPLINLSI